MHTKEKKWQPWYSEFRQGHSDVQFEQQDKRERLRYH